MKNPKSSRQVRKRMTREARRAQILKAALLEIEKRGFKSVTTRQIAQGAGVNEALLFNHFKNKNKLLEAAAREMVDGHPAQILPVAKTTEASFFEQLSIFEGYFLGLNRDNPARLKVLMYGILEGISLPGQMDPFQADGFVFWMVSCIEKGKREWGFRQDLVPLEVVPMFFGALFHFVLLHHVVRKGSGPLPPSMSLADNFRHTMKAFDPGSPLRSPTPIEMIVTHPKFRIP
jgi:AcrR family transcriptional regulator